MVGSMLTCEGNNKLDPTNVHADGDEYVGGDHH